jgi:membrane protease YdiL (CAAX protease family)
MAPPCAVVAVAWFLPLHQIDLMLTQRAVDTLANLVILVGLPLLVYYGYHRWRHGRTLAGVLQRSGLQRGEPGHLKYALAGVAVIAAGVVLLPPDLEAITREGSAQARFAGAGLGLDALGTAALYAFVQTGFAEEFLFRGMIAGSLGRRMSLLWANVIQAAIFLAPHLLLLAIMPEHWPLLILIFGGALYTGWLRIASGSIVGPWLLHGSANFAVTLSVLTRTMPAG